MNPRRISPATIITGPRYTGSSSCIQNDNMGTDAKPRLTNHPIST